MGEGGGEGIWWSVYPGVTELSKSERKNPFLQLPCKEMGREIPTGEVKRSPLDRHFPHRPVTQLVDKSTHRQYLDKPHHMNPTTPA